MKAILGRKLGMTQIFKGDNVVPVTVIQAGPVSVLQKLTKEKNGYEALQIGFEEKSKIKNQKSKTYRYVKEFKGAEGEAGEQILVSLFKEGDKVKVSGVSKGKGYQGGVKRHGMSGRNATHGVKHEERTIGSTGMRFPQRVIKGRKMPGRMGGEKITTRNLQIVQVDEANNVIALKGAVPGRPGTLLFIRLES